MLTMTYTRTNRNPYMDDADPPMAHWRVTLRNGRRAMTITYSKGSAHGETPPTLEEVAECLEADAGIADSCPTFHDFCAEYGYDEDSRKGLRTYQGTLNQSRAWNAIKDAETLALINA